MQTGLIGVIVPVYKTEEFVAECIESILAQTYTKLRLILVDDGSPDGAGAICDQYAAKDNRITVIHQENAGVTRARARGVEEASDCEWITFVDSDDAIIQTALYEYINIASDNTDIILNTTFYTEDSHCVSISDFYRFKGEHLPIQVLRERMIITQGGMPWGRMFRRAIITPFAFDIPRDIYYGEDAIMNTRIAFNTDKEVAITDKPLYFYRQQNNGVCNNFTYTHQYEELLKKHVFKSIPHNEFDKYKNCYIYRRLWIWKIRYNKSYRKPDWSNTNLHKNLIDEIKKYGCTINTFDWLLLKYTNPIIRFAVIFIRRIISVFKILLLK